MNDLLQVLMGLLVALSAAMSATPQAKSADVINPPAIVESSRVEVKGTVPEIQGTIQSIDGNRIVVNGQNITVPAGAEVQGKLQVGAAVKVEGTLQPDGTVLAREVKGSVASQQKIEIENAETEVRGTIQSVNGNTIVVAGRTVVVPMGGEARGQLQVGASVKVEGTGQSNGTILAREIKAAGIKVEAPKVEREQEVEIEHHGDRGGDRGGDHRDGHSGGDHSGGHH